jgi:hypothetical protein
LIGRAELFRPLLRKKERYDALGLEKDLSRSLP